MCTPIVSCLTNFEEGEEEALEEAEEGKLEEAEEGGESEENEANNLVLELSADLEEEEQHSQKEKPTIAQNTRKKAERRKR